jgi:4-hydroxy-tetrahydrodipicolinate reductase
LQILISGSGNMGRTIANALAATDDISVAGCVDKLASAATFHIEGGADVPLYTDAARACDELHPDAVIDFTNAAWTPELTAACVPRGVRPVIGTTGLTEAYVDDLARLCAEHKLGGIVAANFSIGAILMMHMAKTASRFFDSAEIIELHHDRKVDAPSGTSLATARAMIAARDGRPFDRNIPDAQPLAHARDAALDGVTIHSVRLPGLVAHQEVIFGATGQTLTIRHDSTREAYIPGILLATREVMRLDHLIVGLDHLMDL